MTQSNAFQKPLGGVGAPLTSISLERTISPLTRWAFYAWMFALPFDAITPTWLPNALQGFLSIPRMAGLALTLAFLLDPKLWPWRLPRGFSAIAAFFAVYTVSMLRNDFTNFVWVFQQFQLVLLLVICYNLFLTGLATRTALFSFVLSSGISAAMMLLGWTTDVYGSGGMSGRESAFGIDPNLYSKMLIVGVVVAIGIGHVRREKGLVVLPLVLPLLWALALSSMIAVADSASRSMTLALVVGLATFVLRKGSFWVRLRNLMLLAVVACVAFWILSHSDVLKQRWIETIETGATSSRGKIAMGAIEMIKDRPFIGFGPSANSELSKRLFQGWTVASHNMVLEVLIVTGLVGFLPYLGAYVTIGWSAWRARSGVENVLPLAIFMTFFAADMGTGGFPEKLHWTFYAYLLGAGQLALSGTRLRATGRYVATGPPFPRTPLA